MYQETYIRNTLIIIVDNNQKGLKQCVGIEAEQEILNCNLGMTMYFFLIQKNGNVPCASVARADVHFSHSHTILPLYSYPVYDIKQNKQKLYSASS